VGDIGSHLDITSGGRGHQAIRGDIVFALDTRSKASRVATLGGNTCY
jgi:hypothetical protein